MDGDQEYINVSDDEDLLTAYEVANKELNGSLKFIIEFKKIAVQDKAVEKVKKDKKDKKEKTDEKSEKKTLKKKDKDAKKISKKLKKPVDEEEIKGFEIIDTRDRA